jgi:hypothetical protein
MESRFLFTVPHKTKIRTRYDALRASSMATAQPRRLRHRIAAKKSNSRPNLSRLTTTSNSCPTEGSSKQLPSEFYSFPTHCRPFTLCLNHLACAASGSRGNCLVISRGYYSTFEARDEVDLHKHLYLTKNNSIAGLIRYQLQTCLLLCAVLSIPSQ